MTKDIKLLALDVDGTLVQPDNRVAPDVRTAIADVAGAGLRVCLATGRSYVETVDVWQQLAWPVDRPAEAMAVVGGAMVVEPATGRTLWQRSIPRDLAAAFAETLAEAGYSAMGTVDAWRWGLDYLAVPGLDYDDVCERWFGRMPRVKVREIAGFGNDQPPVLRLNALVDPADGPAVEATLVEQFGESMNVHTIFAPNYGVTVVEAFALEASKRHAVAYIAQAYRIGLGAVAAVGDDVNDLPLIEAAGLGVAMPQAPAHVRDSADAVAEDGLAAFIRSLL